MKRIACLFAVAGLAACAHLDAPSQAPSATGVTLFHADGTAAEVVTERSLPRADDGCPQQWTRVERFSPAGERMHRTVSVKRCGVVEFEMREHYSEDGELLARDIDDQRGHKPTGKPAERRDERDVGDTAIASVPESAPASLELATPATSPSPSRCTDSDIGE